jgi:hypothetical protein
MAIIKNKSTDFIFISATMIAAIVLVCALAWSSALGISDASFTRKFLSVRILPIKNIDKSDEIKSIVGSTDKSLYFETKVPGKYFVTDHNLDNGKYITITKHYRDINLMASRFTTAIDSPNVYIFPGNITAYIIANLTDSLQKMYKVPASGYTRAAYISPNTFVFRAVEGKEASIDQIFIKINTNSPKVTRENNISARKGDAGFSTDGLLYYDKHTNLLTYVYFYENRFICMDTNLNLIYRAFTIDTTLIVKPKGGKVQQDDSTMTYTNTTPSRTINFQNCTFNGHLYINSLRKSASESTFNFKNNSVIDIYDIEDGRYLGSFYIPDYNEEKLKRFKVFGDWMIVLTKNKIMKYNIPSI